MKINLNEMIEISRKHYIDKAKDVHESAAQFIARCYILGLIDSLKKEGYDVVAVNSTTGESSSLEL